MWMLEGINYPHAKFQINILRNKKVIKLLELWTLWLKRKEKRKENSEYKSCYHNSKKEEEDKLKLDLFFLRVFLSMSFRIKEINKKAFTSHVYWCLPP